MRAPALLGIWLAAGCGGGAPSGTAPAALRRTLDGLAALGDKHVGTDAGRRAADYVRTRMVQAGLHDVHLESSVSRATTACLRR
jgi:hypothetical protein